MNKILLLFLLSCFIGQGQTVGLTQHDAGTLDEGYILFAPISSTTTYLIDKCGRQIKTWPSSYRPSLSAYLLEDGTLLRTGKVNSTTFTASGSGGIIQKIDWNGSVVWSYTIADATKCQHHDIKALPNGNILVIAYDLKTNTEAIAAGRNAALVNTTLWSEQIIELQPQGTNQANVVWEWHLWDHLVQDFDATKSNFGTIASNSQLLNINYGAVANPTGIDWIHLNAIDYNPVLDQIMVSSRFMDEIWIIDHSTTTAQAASHNGGNAGKGGDFLYRWGNPNAYNIGVLTDRTLFGQHNAKWIKSGLPFQNQILIFNNGFERTGGNYSTIEIINPPVNGFSYNRTTLPFLPTAASWSYNAGNSHSFYAANISGAQQLSNGNILFCDGPAGTFSEITAAGTKVWSYINPVSTAIISQGALPAMNSVFRSDFYPSDYSGFANKTLVAGSTIENSNAVSTNCNLVLANAVSDAFSRIKVYPNPANDKIIINLNNYNLDAIEICNAMGQQIKTMCNVPDEISVNTENWANGLYIIKVIKDSDFQTFKIVVGH